jgi:large subunit ribosomal protein L17
MRHLKAHRKLGRTSDHRRAMFSNMVASLFTHGQIETTEPKAKELRSVAERAITWAKSVSDLAGKSAKSLKDEERIRIVHAKRMARRVVKNEDALEVLFASIGPSFSTRPGGYTRVLKTRFRPGDAAPMALIQLVDWKPAAAAKPEKPAPRAEQADDGAQAAPAKATKKKAKKSPEE